MSQSFSVLLRRVALVALGFLLFLGLVEGALRIGALFVGRGLVERPSWSGKWRVLSLGDSNTYGLYLDKTQAYPMVFERLWNAQAGSQAGVEVLNLAFPGTNSSKVVKEFRRMLRTFRPDVVTVMVGANDFWTMRVTADESPDWTERLGAALWRRSRAYRLFYIAMRGLDVRQLDVTRERSPTFAEEHGSARFGDQEFDLGWRKVPAGGVGGGEPTVEIRNNLVKLAADAADFGTKLVFLTYAADSHFYFLANNAIRAAAVATHTPLIEVAAVLKKTCSIPEGADALKGPFATCPELFPDQHPTALGNERVASILVDQLGPVLQ